MDKDNSSLTTRNTDLVISSFSLQKNGAVAIGNPTFEQWNSCLNFVQKSEQAVHFWLGDLLNWGEAKFGEMYAQAIDVTGFDYQTLANDKSISSKVNIETRKSELSFAHHKAVAKLSPPEQKKWLNKALEEGLSVRELQKELAGKTETELEKKESIVELEIAAKNFCEKNQISREDMTILIVNEEGEQVMEKGKLKKIDDEIKGKLKFLFGK